MPVRTGSKGSSAINITGITSLSHVLTASISSFEIISFFVAVFIFLFLLALITFFILKKCCQVTVREPVNNHPKIKSNFTQKKLSFLSPSLPCLTASQRRHNFKKSITTAF